MTKSSWDNLSLENQTSLRSLIRALERSQGMFSLILVRCNYRSLRDQVHQLLQENLSIPYQTIELKPDSITLYCTIDEQIIGEPSALIVNNLETVKNLDDLLRVANQSREEFRNNLQCPLAIWINDEILKRLIRHATDFESWASVTIEFTSDLATLQQFILSTADKIFTQLLSTRENVFLSEAELNLDEGSPLCLELRSACEALHNQPQALTPEVEASGEFILGRISDNNEPVAREHYEQSLQLWREVGNWERYAHVQFYLGLWWSNYAARHLQDQGRGLQQARFYLEGTINTFEQIEQPHRVAQFINFLGEVLLRQEDWPLLDTLASRAFTLHQRYSDPFRQSKALGFMAAVAIARQNWSQAEYQATLALNTWQQAADQLQLYGDHQATLSWERSFHRPWYLYFIGKAKRNSDRIADATRYLEEAAQTAEPSYDPDLYTYILNELRDIYYFQQKDYLKAYKIRQIRREIQNRFNLRPFIGPGKLHASQGIINPSLPMLQKQDSVAPEIKASGRQKDIEALLQRIDRKDFRLTVIYGPSGVGKSSLIQAGLIPAIKAQTFDGRRVIPVLQQVYKNWIKDLGHQLFEACHEIYPPSSGDLPEAPLTSVDEILEQIRRNERNHFKTVLIFDQFEEFFFANLDVEERHQFYRLAVEGFRILDVEFILSMKEDYLHLLLAANRLSELDIIGNNILDRNNLYYLGNFTKSEAYDIVKSRVQNTRMIFEDSLINQVVEDLADSVDLVRPIELQIVGAQLQTEEITTKAQYQALAHENDQPKEVLVRRYLEDVVRDCGPENEDIAEIILYLLTNEDGTRPLKTKFELAQAKLYEALSQRPDQINLILDIFVMAGLVLLVPSAPTDSYQLVHDYLVRLIRTKVQEKHQKKIDELESRVGALSQIIRILGGLLVGLVSAGGLIYFLYQNANLLYAVTQQERDSLQNLRIFEGYQSLSLEKAIQAADEMQRNPAIEEHTTLPIHTLQTILDKISEKKSLDAGQADLYSADVNPETRRIVTAGENKSIKVWGFDGSLLKTIDLDEYIDPTEQIWDVLYLDQTDLVVAIDSSGKLSLWNLKSTSPEPEKSVEAHQQNQSLALTRLTITPDRSMLLSAGADGFIRLWDASNLIRLQEKLAHDSPIIGLKLTPDGKTLVSTDLAGKLKIWRIENNQVTQLLHEISLTRPDENNETIEITAFAIAVSADSKWLAVGTDNGFVQLYDLNSGKFQYEFLAHNDTFVSAIAFSSLLPNKEYQLVTADAKGTIRVWHADARKSVLDKELKGHQNWIWNLIPTIDETIDETNGAPLLISTSVDSTLRVWDLRNSIDKSPSLRANFSALQITPFSSPTVWSVSYNPHKKQLLTSGSDGRAKVWQVDNLLSTLSKEPLFTLEHQNSPVKGCNAGSTADVFWVVVSPKGQTIATAGADCTARLWSSQDGQEELVLPHAPNAEVNSVAFSPDGDYLVTGDSTGKLYVWNNAGERISAFSNPAQAAILAVEFSPKGDYVAAASLDGTVKLWRFQATARNPITNPAEPAATLSNHRTGATGVDFSSDGLIVTAARDGKMRVWSLDDVLKTDQPQPIYEEPVGKERVTWVEFLQQGEQAGEWLATASRDGSVIIWDRSRKGLPFQRSRITFKPRYQFDGHTNGAYSVTFLEDGEKIAVAQGDGQVKIWQLEDTQKLIQRGCEWLIGNPNQANPRDSHEINLSNLLQGIKPDRSLGEVKEPDIDKTCRNN
jgi:WD40 repeat protein